MIRTTAGATAVVATLGAGGDIIVNAVFAVESSMRFITGIHALVGSVHAAKSFFHSLFRIDRKKRIPIVPKIGLADGLEEFEQKFDRRISFTIKKMMKSQRHTKLFGKKLLGILDKVHGSIMKTMDKITTVLSDWIACLFPDTAGLAGEVAKTMLDRVVSSGFSYTKEIFNMIPTTLQKMLTDSVAMKKLMHSAVKILKKVIKNMSPSQMRNMTKALGFKVADLVENPLLKGVLGTGATVLGTGLDISTAVTKYIPTAKFGTTIGPKPQTMIIFVINRYIRPNINTGVNLFHQLLPIFLMFVLFIEKYKLIRLKIAEFKYTKSDTKPKIPDSEKKKSKSPGSKSKKYKFSKSRPKR